MLAAAALLHPAILLRKGNPMSWGTRLAVVLTAGAVVLAFASGVWIYPAYVASVRVPLFLKSEHTGLLFETKEHIAFAVMALALGASACAWFAPTRARGLRRAAAVGFALGAALCLVTAALGTWVAAVHGFGSAR